MLDLWRKTMRIHNTMDMMINGNGSKNATIKIGKITAAAMEARDTKPHKRKSAHHVMTTNSRMILKPWN